MKALEADLTEPAICLVEKGCDLSIRDDEGFTAFDYIFSKDLKELKAAVARTVDKKRYEMLEQEYCENRLGELRRLISDDNQEILDILESFNKKDYRFDIIDSDSDKFFDNSVIEENNENMENNIVNENWLSGEDKTNICSEKA